MMSAMWVAGIEHDHPDLPVYEVAGDLLVDGQSVFWTESAPEQVAADFERSRLDWDGHCWIVVGDYVGDVSIFRTAYSTQSSPRLSRAIVERFGTGKGLLLSTVANLEAMGFEYRPKYVVTRAQVNSLLLGACDFFE